MLAGCHTDMWQQPKLTPQEESEFFPDRQSSRPLVPNTVPRGSLREGNVLYTGLIGDQLAPTIPAEAVGKFPNRAAMLRRGQDRFNIFCSPCHSRSGDGRGMIAVRGLSLKRAPASYHTERLRNLPDGHLYDVITNGVGVMYSYASRIQAPEDRWAIVAYIRALQLSQNAPAAVLTDADRAGVATGATSTGPGASSTNTGNTAPGANTAGGSEGGPRTNE